MNKKNCEQIGLRPLSYQINGSQFVLDANEAAIFDEACQNDRFNKDSAGIIWSSNPLDEGLAFLTTKPDDVNTSLQSIGLKSNSNTIKESP